MEQIDSPVTFQKENIDTGQESSACNKEEEIETLDQIPKRSVPNVNVTEKIIFCVDICEDDSMNMFDNKAETTLDMICSAVEFFVRIKQALKPETQVAGICLKESGPIWLESDNSLTMLRMFDPEYTQKESVDLDQIYKVITENITLPDETFDYKLGIPETIYRLIFIYKRSRCIPVMPHDQTYFNTLRDHVHFTTDVIYLHDDKWQTDKCKEIYEALQDVDNGYSYIYEVTKDELKLHQCMAKLLAHPFQRPQQKNAFYSLKKS